MALVAASHHMDVMGVMVWSYSPDEGSAGTLSGGGQICSIQNIIANGSKHLINGAFGASDAIFSSQIALLMC